MLYDGSMSRYKQPKGRKGSQRWIQHLVNERREILDEALVAISHGPIDWCSPLRDDDFSEYRDGRALEKVGVHLSRRPLESFWPPKGPQWDALGVTAAREPILVEAKAHVSEMFCSAQSSSPTSCALIRKSLDATAKALRAKPGTDWMLRFYQYANRLAHAYLLRTLNGIPAHLVFIYFVGDKEMNGPATAAEWKAAISVLHEALGITGKIPRYVHDVFIDVNGIH